MAEKKSYAELQQALDGVMASLEDADLDVDAALMKYEEGMKLVKQLEDYLQVAENKITKIKASFEQ